MRKFIVVGFGVLAALGFVAPSVASADPLCPGPLGAKHSMGSLLFGTNSRFEPVQIGRYKNQSIACIGNFDANVLRVKWLIPGPDGWVPPNEHIDGAPRLTESDRPIQWTGCLLYGNRGDLTGADFLGDPADKQVVDSEKAAGCRAAVVRASSEGGKIEKIDLSIHNFLPSNIGDPKASMLQLDGRVSVEPIGEDSYRSVFSYRFRPAGPEADAQLMTIAPEFVGPAERLLANFHDSNKEPLQARAEGHISFRVNGVRNAVLRYVAYAFFDSTKARVASIQLPVFVPAR